MKNTTLSISLSAVISAAGNTEPQLLAIQSKHNPPSLPSGAFNPAGHRTFELGLRQWVREQTGFNLGYVEQLYTFGDQGRESTLSCQNRSISIGYLALTPSPSPTGRFDACWNSWYRFFPWEDQRQGKSAIITGILRPALQNWANSTSKKTRIITAFGECRQDWIEERVLERYELLYEAGLVPESSQKQNLSTKVGEAMYSDHRRILATAMGRLRGKIKYRPVIFELMPENFTLSALQKQIEAILGQTMHTQNFRRALERSSLVQPTGKHTSGTGGRPAKLFRASCQITQSMCGMPTPLLR